MAGSWSAGANLNTARRFLAGGGSPSQAICMGGSLSGSDNSNATETYNSTSWVSAANLGTARRLLAGGGNSANAICMGGYVSATSALTEIFNGTAWSSAGNLGTARHGLGGVGNASDALAFGGTNGSSTYYQTTSRFNGSTWASTGNLTTRRTFLGSTGTPTAALAMGGQTTSNLLTCEYFSGSSWASAGSFGTAKRLMAGPGISSAAFAVAGYTTTYITNVDRYNGSSWASDTAINTARYGLAGGGTTTSAICMGGVISSSSAVTEVYSDGTGAAVRNAASSRNSSSGRLNRILLSAWNFTELTISTYDGSGQAVHPSVVHIPGGWGGYKYFMAMTPYPSGNDDYENPSLLASNDGEAWVVPTGITNPLEPMPAGSHNCDPCLVWDGGNEILYMYYNRISTTKRIPITQSGGTFSAGVQDTLTLPETAMSIAIKRNGASDWVCWFRSVLYSGPSKLYRCVSTDGVTWTGQTEIPIVSKTTGLKLAIPEIWHQSIYPLSDGRNLWIISMYPNGIASGGYVDLYWGIQADDDSEIWLHPTALITSIATWGTGNIYLSSVMQLENGMYRLYISASTSANHWSIGYADIALY